MSSEKDNIIDAALQEALGGNTPPDLLSATLGKAQAEGLLDKSTPSVEPAGSVRPGPNWRAWGAGLTAAAAALVVAGLIILPNDSTEFNGPDGGAARAGPGIAQPEPVEEPSTGDASENLSLDKNLKWSSGDDAFKLDMKTKVQFRMTYNDEENANTDARDWTTDRESRYNTTANSATVNTVSKPRTVKRAPQTIPAAVNPFVDTEDDALSTFALEHDTGSYALARSYLNHDKLPTTHQMRPEEFINYFNYDYRQPADQPFEISMDGAPSRYGQNLKNSYILRVGVQAAKVYPQERKPAVLTFVIDVSGSMEGASRLGLVKKALAELVKELRSDDTVGIAIYGDNGVVHMQHKSAANKEAILTAIDSLTTNGSTNAEEGLIVGYSMAEQAFKENAINRVILCSDGVANLGSSTPEAILKNVIDHRRKGITLSAIGFGMDTYDDNMMEQLGDKGDGHYAYVDSIDEARRIFVENLTGTLQVAGRDVKVQVEFNPAAVKSYRLIGYVNRDVADKDFRNNAVDGGEIGAGHAATAIYEIKLHDDAAGFIARTTLRYKLDERDDFKEISWEMFSQDFALNWDAASPELRLAADVAEFAEIMGEGFYAKRAKLEPVLQDVESISPYLRDEKVDELITLIKKAIELKK